MKFRAFLFTYFLFKKIFYLFIFRDRGREGEREGENHCKCPDWELNPQPRYVPWPPFALWDDAQPTEPSSQGPGAFKQHLSSGVHQGQRPAFSSLLRQDAGDTDGSEVDVLKALGASSVGTNWGLQ